MFVGARPSGVRDTMGPNKERAFVKIESMQFNDLAVFVSVVDAGGFSAAARATGARKAQLSRRVQELERHFGTRLLERTTRVVRLTEIGAAFYERASRAVLLAREAAAIAEASGSEPVGAVRVSTTQLLAEVLLRPVVVRYLRRYPRASIEIDVTSRPVDIVREGFDLAVRVGTVEGPNLVSRAVGRGRSLYVTTPDALAHLPAITTPKDLERVDSVTIAGSSEWTLKRGRRTVVVRPRARLTTPSYNIARDAVLAGVGVGCLPGHFIASELSAGRLVAVLENWTPREVPICVVFPSRDLLAPKTRALVDILAEHAAKHPLPTVA